MPIPNDLSKLSNVVKNDLVKKVNYNKFIAKVNDIDTSDFVLKTKYSTDKAELENKIPATSGLIKKADYNTKITEIENKIPDISNLATNTLVNKVENIIPDISNIFLTLATNVFNTRSAQANLITKRDFNTKLSNLHRKITQNKLKHLLVENELNKLKTFDSSYFIGKSHFEEDGVQNYLVFQPMYRYFKTDSSYHILS